MAVDFDPTSGAGVDYLYKPSPTVTAVPLTFACWFNSDSDSETNYLVSLGKSSVGNHYFALWQSRDSLRATTRAVSAANSSTTTVAASTWHHGAGVFATTSSRTVYLDGVAGSANTATKTPSGVDVLRIGATGTSSPETNNAMKGKLAEVAIWNVALTAADIATLAEGFLPTFIKPESLISYYPLVRDYSDRLGNNSVTESQTVTFAEHTRIIEGAGNTHRSAWGGI